MLTALTRTCLSWSAATWIVMAWSGLEVYVSTPSHLLTLQTPTHSQDTHVVSGTPLPWCPSYMCCVNTKHISLSLSLRYVVITTTNRDLPVKAQIRIVTPQIQADNQKHNTTDLYGPQSRSVLQDCCCTTGQ